MQQPRHNGTNLTVLGVASLSTTLPVVGAVLVLLFVLMKPEATSGFAFHERLAYWAAHIGLGLASLVMASKMLRAQLPGRAPQWLIVLATGLIGAAILAPLYLLLEGLVPAHLVDEPDDWLDEFAARGGLQAVIAEFIEVAPVFLAAWFAVNLPLLFGAAESGSEPPQDPDEPADQSKPEDDIRARLPRAIGSDIVLISSDMHYLHVHTTRGKCMLLGTLRDAARQLGETGMLVHRSHWVAHDHVQRLARRGRNWECVMSNDLRVPISRRNQQKAAEWYGRTGNVVSLTANKARATKRPG